MGELAEAVDLMEEAGNVVFPGDVGLEYLRADSVLPAVLRNAFGGLAVARVIDGDVISPFRREPARRGADAARTAGDEEEGSSQPNPPSSARR